MKNTIRNTVTGLIYQSKRAQPGVLANLVPLGYSTAQGEAFNTHVNDLVAARDAHSVQKVTLSTNRTAHNTVAKTARALVMTARDVLKPYLGREHSAAWIEAGFATSLEVSRDGSELLRTAQGLKAFFTTHADYEIASLNITAERFNTIANDLIARIAALDAAKSAIITLAKDRDAKAKLVREDLRLLLSKLRVSFDPFAAMWELLGFVRPGFRSVPEIPANLLAILIGPNAVAMKWDAAVRAQNYRIWKKVIGVDEDFVAVELREDLDFVIEGLPSGATIELAVSAVNSGGESAKSEVVTIQTS